MAKQPTKKSTKKKTEKKKSVDKKRVAKKRTAKKSPVNPLSRLDPCLHLGATHIKKGLQLGLATTHNIGHVNSSTKTF